MVCCDDGVWWCVMEGCYMMVWCCDNMHTWWYEDIKLWSNEDVKTGYWEWDVRRKQEVYANIKIVLIGVKWINEFVL